MNRDKPAPFFAVFEMHGDARRGKNPLPRFGPFHEDNCVVEVRLEIAPLGCGDAAEAEKIQVGDVDTAAIAMPDREGRTRDRPVDTQGTAGAAHERRLPGAELPGDGDDVTGLQGGGQPRGDLLGLSRRAGLDQKRPSWTAGSAVTAATKTGSGGATSRPSSSGSLAKSDFSTSSIRGV